MTWEKFLHVLGFLHFADNSHRPDKGEEYEQLWKLRTVFDKLHDAYAKFYKSYDHLAEDYVIVKCMRKGIFRQYIPKKENISAS